MRQLGLLVLFFCSSAFATELPEDIICVDQPDRMGTVYTQPDYKNHRPWALVYERPDRSGDWFETTYTPGNSSAEGTWSGVNGTHKGVLTVHAVSGIGRYEGSFTYFDGTNSTVYPVKCEIPD